VREINGRIGLVANLSSWYVKPAYRGWSNALLAAAIEAPDISYTSLTPGRPALRVLRAMGFEPLDRAKWFAPPGMHLNTLRKPRLTIVLDPSHINNEQQRILNDHAPYEGLPVLMIDDAEALLIVRRRYFRGVRLLPCSEVLYCSAPAVLKRHVEAVKLAVMREQKTLGLLFGEHLRCGGIRLPHQTLFRSSSFAPHELDKLYSELTLLPV
jgi:acetoacetyl-CoA synthetase